MAEQPQQKAPTLAYAKQPPWWGRDSTPEEERRGFLVVTCLLGVVTLGYWVGMFVTCRPALALICIGPFMPWILSVAWGASGWMLFRNIRRYPPSRRRLWWTLLALMALLLAPYSLVRADNDMFALGVRYRIHRAGGAEKVQAEFGQWLAGRPAFGFDPVQKFLFRDVQPGGSLVPVPAAQLPPSVRYIREHIPSRFGIATDEVARLDMVAFPNAAEVMIGPPGWKPEGSSGIWDVISGRRRKIADGIWIEVGFYNK